MAERTYAGKQMASLLEQADHLPDAPEPVRRSVAAPVVVGAADDRAEVEADAVAAQVMDRLAQEGQVPHSHAPGCGHEDTTVRRRGSGGPGAIGASGGVLDDAAAADLAATRGGGDTLPAPVRSVLEQQLGTDLRDVRVHADSAADQLAGHMSAQAFTQGSDIYFAAGAYQPDSPSGLELIAHEAAHVVQQRQGRVAPTAQRKLRGTAKALQDMGEVEGDKGKSSGFLRKLVGKLTNWDKLVRAVRDYEAEEAQLLGGGQNPSPLVLNQAKPRLLTQLARIQRYIAEWRKANDDEKQNAKMDKASVDDQGDMKTLDKDTRTKASRRQAVAMLAPRVGNEEAMLQGDGSAWLKSLGLSDAQQTGTGAVASGQMNKVKELKYQTENGEFSGYFKKDKGFNEDQVSHEQPVGIKQYDPNYGARAVALYRLDQLFNAGVTARAEFAVRTNKKGKSVLGTVLESAPGQSLAKTTTAMTTEHAQQLRASGDKTAISMNDPVLQRGLNKLQILDAISGQLDRHGGNYHIDSDDQGNVTSVTGIDLDMAFGANMKGVAPSNAPGAFNYKGLPEFIDREMGEKILQIQPGDIRDALTGLLPDAEVAATVSRFREVQTAVMDAQANGKLRDTWGVDATKEGSTYAELGNKWHDRPTYVDEVKGGAFWDLRANIGKTAQATIRQIVAQRDGTWEDLPEEAPKGMVRAFGYFHEGRLIGPFTPLAELLWETSAADRAVPITAGLVKEIADKLTVNQLWVFLQEGREGSAFDGVIEAAVEKLAAQHLAARLPAIRAQLAKKS